MVTRLGTVGLIAAVLFGSPACEPEPDAAFPRDVPERTGEVDLAIGAVDGPDEHLFGRIAGVAQDSTGRVFIADAQSSDVRVFTPEGRYAFVIGRAGSGPGEFRDPCCITFDARGHLWVRDNGNARYQTLRIREDSTVAIRSLRFHHGDANRWAPITFDREGRLIDIGYSTATAREASLGRMHVDRTGEIVDAVAIVKPPAEDIGQYSVARGGSDGAVTFQVYQPFGPSHLLAHGPRGQWAEALSSRYRIRWHLPDGSERVIEEPVATGPELTSEERDRAAAAIERDLGRLSISRADLPYGVPDRKQPLSGLVFDRTGRLWVERSVHGDATERVADLYGPDGRLLERRVWPRDVTLTGVSWIEDDYAVGTSRDSLGVNRAVRVRF